MTSSMEAATKQFRSAFNAGGGVFHVVTDDFAQVISMLEIVYFRRDIKNRNKDPNSLSNIRKNVYENGASSWSYRELMSAAADLDSNNDQGDSNPSSLLADSKQCVFYVHPIDDHDKFSHEQIRAINQFIERRALRQEVRPDLDETEYSCLILYGKNLILPSLIKSQVTRITFPVLSYDDVKEILLSYERHLDEKHFNWYVNNVKGFEEAGLKTLLKKILNSGPNASLQHIDIAQKIITAQKKQRLSINGKLTFEDTSGTLEIKGMKNILSYLDIEKRALEKHFTSKGMLFVGVPGSGKSAMAKYTAKYLDLPLIRLGMERVLGNYVGDSEQNMSIVLQDLQEMAPCVFWIDEIEKAMSGSQGNDGSGVITRLMGMLLTFLQESKAKVFTVVTANKISGLPDELFRNGRFDARFAAMIPDYETCHDILALHLGAEFRDFTEQLLEIITNMRPDSVGKFSPNFPTGADIAAIAENFKKRYAINNKDNIAQTMSHVCKYILPTANSSGKGLSKIAQSYCDLLNLNIMMSDGNNVSPESNQSEPLFQPSNYHPERLEQVNNDKEDTKLTLTCMDKPSRVADEEEILRLQASIRESRDCKQRFYDVQRLFDSLMFMSISHAMDKLLTKKTV